MNFVKLLSELPLGNHNDITQILESILTALVSSLVLLNHDCLVAEYGINAGQDFILHYPDGLNNELIVTLCLFLCILRTLAERCWRINFLGGNRFHGATNWLDSFLLSEIISVHIEILRCLWMKVFYRSKLALQHIQVTEELVHSLHIRLEILQELISLTKPLPKTGLLLRFRITINLFIQSLRNGVPQFIQSVWLIIGLHWILQTLSL